MWTLCDYLFLNKTKTNFKINALQVFLFVHGFCSFKTKTMLPMACILSVTVNKCCFY